MGITARVLADLGRLQDAAAKVVLGAAVVDDILGLVILAVVTGIGETGRVALPGVALLSGKAVVFLPRRDSARDSTGPAADPVAGVITEGLYAVLVAVVMLTTFAAPPWLKALYRTSKAPVPS